MLKTINGSNSLLKWSQNANHSNIFQDDGSTELDDTIKTLIADFFNSLNDKMENSKIVKFSVLWEKESNTLVRNTINTIRRYCQLRCTSVGEEALKRVAYKVRGNVGEILGEQYFKSFSDEYDCDADRYEPVDPHKEYKLDAQTYSVLNENIPIGIQIKNWDGPITDDVLISASYEDAVAIRQMGDNYREYILRPRQYVFSFTDLKTTLWIDEPRNSGIVRFIGPSEIDKHTKSMNIVLKKIINSLNAY